MLPVKNYQEKAELFFNFKKLNMKKVNRLHYLLALLFLLTFTACQKENKDQFLAPEKTLSISEDVNVPSEIEGTTFSLNFRKIGNKCNTYFGPVVQMGNGHVRSWINISKCDNKPMAIGIEFTPCAFENLPTNAMDFAGSTFNLKLHQKATAITPFNHITLNWNPHGHEPAGIYDVPHFDMHFYKISIDEQMLISGMKTAAPAPGYLPASYKIEGGTVPQMGTHWLDPSFPELPPTLKPFTHTLIYGSNNGQVIFLEPMITTAFLLGGTYVSKPISQPIHFSPSGTNYPTVYKIWKNAENGRHYVALTDFVWR